MLDAVRELGSATGRARRWTRLVHRGSLHQITEYTEPNRYPALFDLAARLRPDAKRILSFGCSSGEELESIRRRFPDACIVGAEINPRSRAAARTRVANDPATQVVQSIEGQAGFDVIFALAVLQFQPHRIEDEGVQDLAPIYPFRRFEQQVTKLTAVLKAGGLLCVMHTHYRIEDCTVASQLMSVEDAPALGGPLFRPDGWRYDNLPAAQSMFIKRPD
ncbi:MAG TPA: methyltransferase domain-containing protein [Sphingomicrobium sp.]